MKLPTRVSTGIEGLDELTCGGLPPRRAYLVRGAPGAGKTMLGWHFLREGATCGEPALCISLGEPETQVRENAARLNFDLDGVHFLDLSPDPEFFSQARAYDLFLAGEVERAPITQAIVDRVEAVRPQRVFLDAMSQLRYLSTDTFQFRKQALSFLRFLVQRGATVIFASESNDGSADDDLQFMSDGVITLSYSGNSRSVQITKLRGSDFLSGVHTIRIDSSGMQVFPRLMPELHHVPFSPQSIPSGVPELDELLHGGLERGTITIISGPSGVGKTSIGLQFMKEAAGRGERSVLYIFEEAHETLIQRCESINIPARMMVDRGTLAIIAVEPLQLAPDELAWMVREEVEQRNARIVMIDSTAGHRLSLRGEDPVGHLHALCRYLKNMGVTVILVNEIETIGGDLQTTEIGISYLADNILIMRYMEHYTKRRSEIRKVIGVLKKRLTDFEKTLREIEITRYGIKIGQPMPELRGLLNGTPSWHEPASDG